MNAICKKIIAATLITFTVTGCGAGRDAETRNIKQVTDGVEGQSGEVILRNVKIVKNNLSEGILIGTIINLSDEADAITGISIDAVPAQISAASLDLVKNKPITFVGDSANADAFALITKSEGSRLPIIFSFKNAAPITLDVLVVVQDGIYTNLVRVNSPIPTPSNS